MFSAMSSLLKKRVAGRRCGGQRLPHSLRAPPAVPAHHCQQFLRHFRVDEKLVIESAIPQIMPSPPEVFAAARGCCRASDPSHHPHNTLPTHLFLLAIPAAFFGIEYAPYEGFVVVVIEVEVGRLRRWKPASGAMALACDWTTRSNRHDLSTIPLLRQKMANDLHSIDLEVVSESLSKTKPRRRQKSRSFR